MEKKKHKCEGCVWGRNVGNKYVCMFGKCVKDKIENYKIKTGLRNADHMKQFANSDNHKKSVKRFRKLSEGQAKEIKKLIRQGKSDREISKIYNVSRGCIYGIRSNKTYKEVIA